MLDQELKEELVVQQLEIGKAVERYSYRHRPEKGKLRIRRETHHIVWSSNQSASELISK